METFWSKLRVWRSLDHLSDINLNCPNGWFIFSLLSLWSCSSLGSQLKEGEGLFDFLPRLGSRFWFIYPLPYKLPKPQFDVTDLCSRPANAFREKEALNTQLISLGSCFTLDFGQVLLYYFVSSSTHWRKLERIFLSTFLVVISGPNYLAHHFQKWKFLDKVWWETNRWLLNGREVIN